MMNVDSDPSFIILTLLWRATGEEEDDRAYTRVVTPDPLLAQFQSDDAVQFVDFAGIPLPYTFGEPQAEYAAIRKACGMMPAPHRGVLSLAGKDRHEFLGNLISCKTWDRATRAGLSAGSGAYGFFLNLKGRIVAELTLIERGDELLIDMDRRLVPMLTATFDKYVFTEKVSFADRTRTHTRLSLFGPGAAKVLYDAAGVAAGELNDLGSLEASMFGTRVQVWREDLTASTGLHLLVPNDQARILWQGLLEAFADVGKESNKRRLRPIGWAAFNTTRIEAGRPILGIDYEAAAPSVPGKRKDDTPDDPASEPTTGPTADPASKGILPAESGLFERGVDVNKGCYLGQEIVARMYARKVVARKIVSFKMAGDALPTAGAAVVDPARPDIQVGIVTSSTQSPVLSNACVGLALIKRPSFEPGQDLLIWAEGSSQPAKVVAAPLVRPDFA
jgi:aminomethyltransferase